jgi:hypothetical protein
MTRKGVFQLYVVDALSVCYTIPTETFNELTSSDKEIWGFNYNSALKRNDNFDFLLIRMAKTRLKFELRILDDNSPNNYLRFGTLRLSPRVEDFGDDDENGDERIKQSVNYDDFSKYCFIELENNVFYSPIMTYFEPVGVKRTNVSKNQYKYEQRDPKRISQWGMEYSARPQPKIYIKHTMNSVFMVNLIANFLGLDLYQILTLEIACDTNVNYIKHIIKALHNDNIVIKVNNKDYEGAESTERIKGMFYFYSASRKTKQNPSLYVKQMHKQLQVKFYNKTQELEFNSSYKGYINDWLNKECEIHRIEVTAKKVKIDKYCRDNNIPLGEFLFNLSTEPNLVEPFEFWMNKLIKFRNVKMNGSKSVFLLLELLKSVKVNK